MAKFDTHRAVTGQNWERDVFRSFMLWMSEWNFHGWQAMSDLHGFATLFCRDTGIEAFRHADTIAAIQAMMAIEGDVRKLPQTFSDDEKWAVRVLHGKGGKAVKLADMARGCKVPEASRRISACNPDIVIKFKSGRTLSLALNRHIVVGMIAAWDYLARIRRQPAGADVFLVPDHLEAEASGDLRMAA